MSNFNSSEAGRHAAYAVQILAGARTISEARFSSRRRLLLPMLNLSGHGLELLLKACILINDGRPPAHGSEGHNVQAMWARRECEPVRVHVTYNARLAVLEARSERLYPDIPRDDEIEHLVEDYVLALAQLHGMPRTFPLRYPANDNFKGPRSPMLPQALHMTAEDFCRNPTSFVLQNMPFMPTYPS